MATESPSPSELRFSSHPTITTILNKPPPTTTIHRSLPDRPGSPITRKPYIKPGGTFAAQHRLPKLPIPALPDTISRYLAALKPLQEPTEHRETVLAAQHFLSHEGPGLQRRLKQYASSQISYIEKFWYDTYLNFESSVVLNLNPFFLLEDDPIPSCKNQVTRAASLIYSTLKFICATRHQDLSPDTTKGHCTPLCMYQYTRLFGTARIPTASGCQIAAYPDSQHIIIMCRGQFYWFDVLDGNDDLIMGEKDLSVNFQTIVEDASGLPIWEAGKGALGLLTAQDRKQWARCREELTAHSGNNGDCLWLVDSALFVLCLDYNEPADVAGLCQNMLCGSSQLDRGVQVGTCINRWYNKLQIIICKNGSAGINFEHTGVDGHTVLRFASDVYTDTILRFARSINGKAPAMWATTSPDLAKRDPESFGDVSLTPHKLVWDVPEPIALTVRFSEAALTDLIMQHEFQCLDFGAYGKIFITSMGFSPDAFVQMAFQAAYYSLYGHIECTYEPAMTKAYLHGRTEAIRTVSDESVDFVQTFWKGSVPAADKVDKLRKACQKHTRTTRNCAAGQGFDRHLFALLSLWQKVADDETNSDSGSSDRTVESPTFKYSDDDEHAIDDPDQTKTFPAPPPPSSASMRTRGRSASSNGTASNPANQLPSLFADPGWSRINNCILSTSNCGNPSLRQFGFGPTSARGFGIGYIIKDDSISICVSSKHRQTARFLENLENYLVEIRKALRISGHTANHKVSQAREIDGFGSKSSDKRVPRRDIKARLAAGREVEGE